MSKNKTEGVDVATAELDVRQMAAAARRLEARGFESVTEARIYYEVAASDGGVPVCELARLLRRPNSTTSRVAYGLVERGLLDYRFPKEDRRKRVLVATK